MSEQEIKIAFWTLIISSILNLVTIGCNIYWNSVGKREKKKLENFINARDTILKYYLPIKYNLLQMELFQIKVKEQIPNFDIFSLYSEDSLMRNFREEVIIEYKKYIDNGRILRQKLSLEINKMVKENYLIKFNKIV